MCFAWLFSFLTGMLKQDLSLLNKPSDGTLMAVLVVSAALLFGATLLAAMMIYTRSRNRGRSETLYEHLSMEHLNLVD